MDGPAYCKVAVEKIPGSDKGSMDANNLQTADLNC